MQVSIETTSTLGRKLTVGIPAGIIDEEVEKRLKDAAKTVNIKGFRKGKVPLKVVRQRYGSGVRQEVVGDKINHSVREALIQESVRPAGQPAIEPRQNEAGKDLEFVATFEVFPELALADVSELEVDIYEANIEDKDLEEMITTLQKQNATWSEVAREAVDDDRVNIDFIGKIAGEEFEGGSAQGHALTLGSKAMIPGFEAGIVGMKAGETRSIAVTFPEDYQVEDLRGKLAEFEVTINTVEEQVLPGLDEQFFADYGVSEGEQQFREEVKENMERELRRAIKSLTKQQVMTALLEGNEFELPEALVAQEIDVIRNQMLRQYGEAAKSMDINTLLPGEMFRGQAERNVGLALIVGEFVRQENLVVDGALMGQLIEESASTYEDTEEVINYIYSNKQLLSNMESAALEEQVVNLVIDRATVRPKPSSYTEVMGKASQNK